MTSQPLRRSGGLSTALVVGACAATALGLTACGSSGGGGTLALPNASKSASATPGSSASVASGGTGGTGGTGTTSGTGGGSGTGTGSGGGGTGSGSGGGTGATVTLMLTGKPSCPAGTNLKSFPGSDTVISWSVTGAPGVALYVDGSSGAYGFYGPTGTQDLGFPCDGPPNTTKTHTYTITTRGGATVVSKTISASALINEITNVTGPTAPVSAPASAPAPGSPPAGSPSP